MHIRRDGWVYWFAYVGYQGLPPAQVSLCILVARFVAGVLLLSMGLTVLLAFVIFIGYAIYLLGSWIISDIYSAGQVAGLAVLGFGSGYMLGRVYDAYVADSEAVRLVRGYLKAKKEGVCPIVDIVDDNNG